MVPSGALMSACPAAHTFGPNTGRVVVNGGLDAGTKGPGDTRKALSVPRNSILAITRSIFDSFP